jgi:tRNA (cytidine/uridine-2'-O-)-methyltransferase
MLHIVLYEPEIPSNTGNIIRLCANTGAQLHLIEPLGFALDDKKLRRAGLDYHEWATLKLYDSFERFQNTIRPSRLFAFSTKGTRPFTSVNYRQDDVLLFGPETRGLPTTLLASVGKENCLYLPMQAESRSLNLSNTVSIAVYEGWRQLNFTGAVFK